MRILSRTAATTATLIIIPPTLDSLRGYLMGYMVEYSEFATKLRCTSVEESSKTSSMFPDNTILINGLNPIKEYCVRIAARTSVGVGPYTNGTDEIQCENTTIFYLLLLTHFVIIPAKHSVHQHTLSASLY